MSSTQEFNKRLIHILIKDQKYYKQGYDMEYTTRMQIQALYEKFKYRLAIDILNKEWISYDILYHHKMINKSNLKLQDFNEIYDDWFAPKANTTS